TTTLTTGIDVFIEDTTTITVTINGVNDLDDGDESASTDEDTPVDVTNLLINTVDPEAGDPVVASAGGQDINAGPVTVAGSNGGQFTIASDGTTSFDPNGDFEGLAPGESDTTTVTYVVEDADGGLNTSTVTVTVNGVNDLDDGDETASTDEDTATAIDNLLANTDDPEAGDPVVVSADGQPVVAGTPVQVAGSTGGVFTIEADGTASFDPDGDYESLAPGESDTSTVTYVVEDADGAQNTSTVTVTINGVNDLEDGDETATTDEDTPTPIDNLLLNSDDPEAGTPVVTSAGGDPVIPGTPLQVAGSTGGVFTIASDGTASFDPNAEFEDLEPGDSRITTIEYTVEDDDGGLVTSTVTVTVTGESDNPDPTAVDDAYQTTETLDGQFPLIEENILGNDTDPENDDLDVTELSFNGTDAVRFGDTFLLNVTTALGNSGALSVNAVTGELIFSAGDGFTELGDGDSDSFTVDYGITDGNGGSDDAQITITVNGTSTNSRPDAVDNTFGTTEVTDGVFPVINDNILTNDTDPEDDDLDIIRVTIDGQDAAQNGAGDFQFIATTARGNRGVVAIDPETGEFTFVALDGFAELGDGEVDQFTFEYEITDGNGGRDTADVTVVVDGTSFNARPDAVDNTFGTTEVADGVVPAINGNILDNDTDPEDDPLEITSVTFQGNELTKIDPVNFVLFAFTDKGNGGAVQINSETGDFIFVPGDGFAELAEGEVDGFTLTYEISDGNGGTDTADIVITVDGSDSNSTPNAVNDRYTTTEITDGVYPEITGNLLEDDTDPDAGDGDSLTITETHWDHH
ncbi:MAG: Ig-like domain-containing protein, partial [Pseudomonadota bacterium]